MSWRGAFGAKLRQYHREPFKTRQSESAGKTVKARLRLSSGGIDKAR